MAEYKKDDIVKGIVTGIEEYGAFITFDDNYTGLVHISEMSKFFVNDINNYFEVGEEVEAKVLEVDDKNKKLKLTIKYRTKNDDYDRSIQEVGTGFKPLKDKLNSWIDDKIIEINEENGKKE